MWVLALLLVGALAFGGPSSKVSAYDYKGHKISIFPSSTFPGRLEFRITDRTGSLASAALSEVGELESDLVKRLLAKIDEWEAAAA